MLPDDALLAALTAWLSEKSLAGLGEAEIVEGLRERLLKASVTLSRAIVLVDTLNPIYEGRAFRWNRGTAQAEVLEYGRTREGANAEGWRRSPLYYMVETNRSFLRRRLTEPSTSDETPDFAAFAELRDQGMTDFVALVTGFPAAGSVGRHGCDLFLWTRTTRPASTRTM